MPIHHFTPRREEFAPLGKIQERQKVRKRGALEEILISEPEPGHTRGLRKAQAKRVHLRPVVETLLERTERRPARLILWEGHAEVEGSEEDPFPELRQERGQVRRVRQPRQGRRNRMTGQVNYANPAG